MTTTPKYDYPKPGCYIDASAGSADDCNRRTIEFAEAYGFTFENIGHLSDPNSETYSECLSEIADDAVTYLNDLEPRSFMHWQFEDNSLFLTCDVDGARAGVDFISSTVTEYPPDSYRGEWLHISDHGNATLYVRGNDGQDTEVWGVV